MLFDSSLEKLFATQNQIKKNKERFVIFISSESRKLKITYQPDFVYYLKSDKNKIGATLITCWVEVKGYHKNMQTYLLKRRLITHHCLSKNILFLEFRYSKKEFVCAFSSNKYLG